MLVDLHHEIPVASFTKEVNPRLAKSPLKTNGRLADPELTSVLLVKEAIGVRTSPWCDKYISSNT